jgi:hypothetical protein
MTVRHIVTLFADDSGQDLVEYALICGMVTTGGALFVGIMNTLMRFYYANWRSHAQLIAAPCDPGVAC